MLCSLLKCYAYQRTPSYIIFTHNLFIHNFLKLLLCINKNESIRRIHWFKYPWNLFQCRIQLCWIIFWLRIIKLSVFPYSVIFWVIKHVYNVLHYWLWAFLLPPYAIPPGLMLGVSWSYQKSQVMTTMLYDCCFAKSVWEKQRVYSDCRPV